MRRFTFAAGNLKKVLALPLYGLGALASTLVPRRPRLWVFGSGTGVGEGALALLEHARAADPRLRLVWLCRNDLDARNARRLGIKAVPKDGWRGFRLTLRAGVVAVTHGFGDVNRYGVRGAVIVQLWHGIPFKRLHLDSSEAMRLPLLGRFGTARRALRLAYERAGRSITLFPVASARAGERIRTAFALRDDQIVVTGDPRDDALVGGPEDDLARDARARLAEILDEPRLRGSRLLLFAPTWRDGAADPNVPTAGQWQRLARVLAHNDTVLLVRAHPLGRGDYATGAGVSEHILMLGGDVVPDITPLLPAFDGLVTDYSSIAFDYSLVGGETYFLAPDARRYARRRGTYEPYDDFSGGDHAGDWDALLDTLEAGHDDSTVREHARAHSAWLAERFHTFRDGRNTERVYGEVVRRLDGREPLHPLDAPTTARADAPDAPSRLDALELEEGGSPALLLRGSGTVPAAVFLAGPRMRIASARPEARDDGWSARLPLLVSRWSGPALPPPSGDYRLRLRDDDGRPVDPSPRLAVPEERLVGDLVRIRFRRDPGGVAVTLTPPLRDEERGAANRTALERRYRSAGPARENAVFFESFYGQNVSCNPLGIDRALARLRPDVTRYWSVADRSVAVPDGAIPIVEGSAEWWAARGSARVLVVNDWLRKRFRPREGQSVLQTWHGTPLKRIAMSRRGLRPRASVAAFRESSRWDVMLAQNPFSARMFRRAYAFRGPIWEEGYPRDDVLVTGEAASVRERLGIPDGVRVVLYAPTWRDDRPDEVDHLDAARFARRLGDGFVTLVRGHSRTLRPGEDVEAPGVIDVTGYPVIADLYLAADVLVTDYSSVMFDFTVTGKPIYFFVPDLDHYRDVLRGFTFDLLPVAPGPVLEDAGELAGRIRSGDTGDLGDRYARWRERFNPRDDGGAGERVVRRLEAEGRIEAAE